MSLPYIPIYAGPNAQYITGLILPNPKEGPVITMQFAVQGDPREIVEWYRRSLNQNNWRLINNTNGTQGFIATDKRNIFQVTAFGPQTPGSRSSLTVLYKAKNASSLLAAR
jgi:hypothetical protein